MTRGDLLDAVAQYRRGLDAELRILGEVQSLARAQREATGRHDVAQLGAIAERREVLMASLIEVETQVRPVRAVLARERRAAAGVAAFVDLASRHREAEALVNDILESDRDTARALAEAERARRLAAHVLDAGEATLAAYRRVIAPAHGSAGLVDRRG
jgi:hypothetical protein